MASGGQPRDDYDLLDRTFYYLRLRSNHAGSSSIALIRRSYFSVRFWMEMQIGTHIQLRLILATNCLRESMRLTSQTSCSAIGHSR
jgi:hypothetical protein